MKQALRMSSAAVALAVFLAAPAHAQDQAVDAASEPVPSLGAPASEDAVGPAQLRDFSINGTVTRRADAPAPAQPAPAQAATTPTTPTLTASRNSAPAASATAESRQAGAQQRSAEASAASGGFAMPAPTPSSGQPPSFAPATFPQPTSAVSSPVEDTGSDSFPLWPWIAALLAAIGAGAWYFRRQRSGYAFAGAGGDASAFDLSPAPAPPRAAPIPKPQPAPRAPVPDAAPAPKPATAPVGIVSTRLRPWLEIEFSPEAAIVDDEKGAIQFEVTLFNSGSAPAREVHVEGALFNASPDQDQVLGQFFAQPGGQGGDRITVSAAAADELPQRRQPAARPASPVRSRGPHAVRAAGWIQRRLFASATDRARRRRASSSDATRTAKRWRHSASTRARKPSVVSARASIRCGCASNA